MPTFKPFKISDLKRFQVDPEANIYSTIKKVLRLKKNKNYEIDINVQELSDDKTE